MTNLEKIHSYLAGDLEGTSLTTFLSDLECDKSLQDELAIATNMRTHDRDSASIERSISMIKAIGQEYQESLDPVEVTHIKKPYLLWTMGLAAAIALLLIANIIRPKKTLYEQHFKTPPASFITKNNIDQKQLAELQNHINTNDYQKSLSLIQKIDPTGANGELLFYKGIILMNLEERAQADEILSQLASNHPSFTLDATWYRALNFLAQDRHEEAKTLLQKLEHTGYKERATDILAQIKS